MGWRELRAWIREMNRASNAEAGRESTSPDSWSGRESDAFWVGQRRKHKRMRGR